MPAVAYITQRLMSFKGLSTLAVLALLPSAVMAFNPNEGAEAQAVEPPRVQLPPTTALLDPMPRLVFPPLPANRQVPVENAQVPVENPPQAAVDTTPVSGPEPVGTPIATITHADLPPPPAPPAEPSPATVSAVPPPTVAAPNVTASSPPVAPEPLSDSSKTILSHIPSNLNALKSTESGKSPKLDLKRMSADVKDLTPAQEVEKFDAAGISIAVNRPGLDTSYELNRAYTALMGGDTGFAISTYDNILTADPTNEDALFGLAATYHRLGNIERARPYYGQLLKVNPNHRDGLNNFLALISDEAPQEALAELERLEQRNPGFSPIPAQQALVLSRLGYDDQARDKLLRAIELAPDNLIYKYNLAILLDRQGAYTDASALYRMLIDAALKGQKIPVPAETLQKRLNYIASVATQSRAGS